MNDHDHDDLTRHRSWPHKFAGALSGIRLATAGQSSFTVHIVMAVLVLTCGVLFRLNETEWCLIVLCIAVVLAAETFNSSLESLAKAIDEDYNEHLRVALDMASGAVLWTAIGAATVGIIVFVRRLGDWTGWL